MTTTHILETDKNLLIGVGSQRAGSTLLYRVLNKSVDGLFMHPVKELHFFDSIHKIRSPKALKIFSAQQLKRINKESGDLEEILNSPHKRLLCEVRTNQILSKRNITQVNYIDLFRPFLSKFNWIGEVTPEYMLLSENQLNEIKSHTKGKIIPVLMIRNPAKRFLSAFKLRHFYMRRPNQSIPDNKSLLGDLNFLLDHFESDGWVTTQLRFNEYRAARERLQAVFGSNVLTLSLDTLTRESEKALIAIENLTGLIVNQDLAKECLAKKVNETDVKLELDTSTSDRINHFFASSLEDAEDICNTKLKI